MSQLLIGGKETESWQQAIEVLMGVYSPWSERRAGSRRLRS